MGNFFDELEPKTIDLERQEFFVTFVLTVFFAISFIFVSLSYKNYKDLECFLRAINDGLVPTISSFAGVTWVSNFYKTMSKKIKNFILNIILVFLIIPYVIIYTVYCSVSILKVMDQRILGFVLIAYTFVLIYLSEKSYWELRKNLN